MSKKKQDGQDTRSLGREGEAKARLFLEQMGYQILEDNFYGRLGELDFVAREQEVLVFVEVKAYSSNSGILPQEGVHNIKRRRIVNTARYYMAKHRIPEDVPCRFDVVAIYGEHIELIRDAFWMEE